MAIATMLAPENLLNTIIGKVTNNNVTIYENKIPNNNNHDRMQPGNDQTTLKRLRENKYMTTLAKDRFKSKSLKNNVGWPQYG